MGSEWLRRNAILVVPLGGFALLLVALLGYNWINWEKATRADTVESYERFLVRNRVIFVGAARERLEELEWDKSRSENTAAAYRDYLIKYPAGRFTEQARIAMRDPEGLTQVQAPVPAEAEGYSLVSPAELRFTIIGLSAVFEPDEGGLAMRHEDIDLLHTGDACSAVPEGTLRGIRCNDVDLALESDRFVDGFVLTRDYGRIRVRVCPSLTPSFSVWLTDEQIGSLRSRVGQ